MKLEEIIMGDDLLFFDLALFSITNLAAESFSYREQIIQRNLIIKGVA